MTSGAELEQNDAGLVPASTGWFVLNARDGRWFHKPGRGVSIPLTGCDEYEAETFFPMSGTSIQVLSPGEPNGTGRAVGLLLGGRGGRSVQRVVSGGDTGRRRRLRAVPPSQKTR